jgi:type IV secretory pathway VirB9-like protein
MLGASLFAAEPSTESRTVQVHKSDITSVNSLAHFTTVIELPRQEEIMDAYCGDKSFWSINYDRNLAFVRPDTDKPGERTNINLVTTSGNVYSFIVREVSKDPAAKADLRMLIEQADTDSIVAMNGKPQYVRADQLVGVSRELQDVKSELIRTRVTAADKEVKNIHHDYAWKHGKEEKLFAVHAIYHDDKFTYIEASPQEAPTLYKMVDGKDDAIVDYKFVDGRYRVPEILEGGYLRIGKSKLAFKREKESS